MSKPPPFVTRKKDEDTFDFFMQDFLTAVIDLHRSLGNLREVEVPTSMNSPGEFGMVAISSNFIYFCVSTNTWKRITLSPW